MAIETLLIEPEDDVIRGLLSGKSSLAVLITPGDHEWLQSLATDEASLRPTGLIRTPTTSIQFERLLLAWQDN